jgi:GntR family transcriptional repressor for pyruvate dehydrogenase complex
MVMRSEGYMKPIGKANLSRAVMKSILQSIKDEQFRAGDRIPPIKELGEALDVGISTVREGLKQLQSMGIVRIVQGKGVYVDDNLDLKYFLKNFKFLITLKKQEFANVMEARKTLEPETAKLAAMRALDTEIEELHRLITKLKDSTHDLSIYNSLDVEFHIAIAKAAKNPVLIMFLESIQGLIENIVGETTSLPDQPNVANVHHEGLYNAIKNHEPEKARELMISHLLEVETSADSYLYSDGNQEGD